MFFSKPAQISASDRLFRSLSVGILKLSFLGLSTAGLMHSIPASALAIDSQMIAPVTESLLSTNGSRLQRAGFFADQGLQAFGRGDRSGAAQHWQRALALYQASGDRAGAGRMLENLSVLHRLNNEADEAISLSEQAIALYEELGIADTQPSAYLNLGSAYRMSGRMEDAIATYRRGLDLYQRAEDIQGERIMLSLLAQIHKDLSDYPQTITYQHQALTLSREIGNAAAEAEALAELGYAYVMNEQPGEAIAALQPASEIYRQLRDRVQEVAVLNNLGKAAFLQKDYDLAMRSYEQALTIFQALNRPEQSAHVLINMGQVQAAVNNVEGAIASYQQAINLTETLRRQSAEQLSPRQEAAYRTLAILLQQQNRMAEAQQILSLI